MYCPSCGKQIPDKSAYCLHCGKPTGLSLPTPTVTEWDYDIYVYSFLFSGMRARIGKGAYSESEAKLEFWQNHQDLILEELQIWYDHRWEPVGEIGPAGIKIRTFRSMGMSGGEWLLAIILGLLTLGLYFLFGWHTYATPVEFRLKMRRPKRSEEDLQQHAEMKAMLLAKKREHEGNFAKQVRSFIESFD